MRFKNILPVLCLWTVILLPLCSSASEQSEDLFTRANALYAKAQYQQALNSYQKIIAAGEHSAAVYFNMGNASYKLGDLPSALLYYERAHRLSPNDEDINANIRLANSKTRDKIEELPEFFLSRWWTSVYLSFSANVFAVCSVILLLAASAFLIVYFFAHRITIKKPSFFIAVTFFALGFCAIFMLSQQISYFDQKHAIVFNSPVYVKSAPAETARDLLLIHEGVKVTVLEDKQQWLRVRLANGSEGWMKAADLKEI